MSWGAIGGAAVGLVGTALTSKGRGGGGGAPDPIATARAQGEENRRTFAYQLANSRINTVNPFGTSTWRNNKQFDQAGFDRATARYNDQGTRRREYNNQFPSANNSTPQGGRFVATGRDGQEVWMPDAASNGVASFEQNEESIAPVDRAAFEGPDNWENTQALSEQGQRMFDSSGNKLEEAIGNISTNADNYQQTVADAVQRRLRRYQDPADEQMRQRQQSDLADRGFQIGNEATSAERTRLDDSIQRGQADTADRAQLAGFTQGQAQLSMQQQIAERLANLRAGIGQGVSTMPSQGQTPGMQPVDIAGLINGGYANQVDMRNADNASNENLIAALSRGTTAGIGAYRGRQEYRDVSPTTFGEGNY